MTKSVTLLLVLVLTSSSTLVFLPVKAQFQGNITIDADGNVSPLAAPIEHAGNTYLLTNDINGSITVNANNIVLDGDRHTITFGDGVRMVSALALNDVSNVTVKDYVVNGGWFGIAFSGTDCLIANNTVTGTGNGVYSIDEPTAAIGVTGNSNIISGNYLANNYAGIVFYQGMNNIVVENTVRDTAGLNDVPNYAIMFWGGALNNTIYHNNFENNASPQAFNAIGDSPVPINVWDDGYPGGGNYWSDYQIRYPKAVEIDSSRIADTPYVIDAQNKDRYPLMYAFNEYYVLQATPPKVSLLSPLNQTYNGSSVPLVFKLDKLVNWVGYSLDGEPNVTVAGNSTIANVTDGLHSIIVYANDTFGNIGASETVNFTIALAPLERSEPLPTTLIAVASIAVVVVVGAGLLVYFKKRKR